jgi:hypothetical protein
MYYVLLLNGFQTAGFSVFQNVWSHFQLVMQHVVPLSTSGFIYLNFLATVLCSSAFKFVLSHNSYLRPKEPANFCKSREIPVKSPPYHLLTPCKLLLPLIGAPVAYQHTRHHACASTWPWKISKPEFAQAFRAVTKTHTQRSRLRRRGQSEAVCSPCRTCVHWLASQTDTWLICLRRNFGFNFLRKTKNELLPHDLRFSRRWLWRWLSSGL